MESSLSEARAGLVAVHLDPDSPDPVEFRRLITEMLQQRNAEGAKKLQRYYNAVICNSVPVSAFSAAPLQPVQPPTTTFLWGQPAQQEPVAIATPAPSVAPVSDPPPCVAPVVDEPAPGCFRGKVAYTNAGNVFIKPSGPIEGEKVKQLSCQRRLCPQLQGGEDVEFQVERRGGNFFVRSLRQANAIPGQASLDAFKDFDVGAHSWCMARMRTADVDAAIQLLAQIAGRIDEELHVKRSTFIDKSYGPFVSFVMFLFNEAYAVFLFLFRVDLLGCLRTVK
eukprot:TRINITY_DN12770_c0_g1_i1.p1 TRINITY_DN12770_c0_g1~~TRINITY_DN12770_c0_g1_i1.p1  ORF type:complete len:287 (-),score=47.35 TRINITY_DN12770_c0_g1_i1:119-958(-)